MNVCCGEVNRGVAAWNGKIFVGTLDGRLVALDAATGKEVWSTLTIDRTQRYSITGAVRVVKGRVLVGNWRRGVRRARLRRPRTTRETGKLAWRFYTVPGNPARRASRTRRWRWPRRPGTASGGSSAAAARAWDALVYDPSPISSIVGVGNGSPWNQALRSPGGGDNLFLASIVALDPDDG